MGRRPRPTAPRFHRTAHLCRGRIVHRDCRPRAVVIRTHVDTNRDVVVRHRFDSIRTHVDTIRFRRDLGGHTHGIRHGHTCFSRVMSWSCDWRRRKNACSDVPKFAPLRSGFYMRHVALQQVSIPYRVIPYIFRNIGTNRLQPAPLLGFSLFRSCTFPFRLPNNEAFVPKFRRPVASFLGSAPKWCISRCETKSKLSTIA